MHYNLFVFSIILCTCTCIIVIIIHVHVRVRVGLKVEGIYRVSASLGDMNKLKEELNRGEVM